MFVSNLKSNPLAGRFIVGIHSRPKLGKTTLLTDLALRCPNVPAQYLFLLSFDGGLSRVYNVRPEAYQGRLLPIHILSTADEDAEDAKNGVPFSFLGCLRKRIRELILQRMPALRAKGVGDDRVWIGLDTVTRMQSDLLLEESEAQIESALEVRGTRKSESHTRKDRRNDELLQQVDWGINLNVMSSIINYIQDHCRCNIVYTFLEKGDKDYKERYRATIAIQGASYSKLMGDMDVIVHLRLSGSDHVLETRPTAAWEAGDRYGLLPAQIPFVRVEDGAPQPTLLRVRELIFNRPQQAAKGE